MKKRVLSLIICMVMALSMIQTPILSEAAEKTEDTNRLYTKTEVSEYRDKGTYPEKTGYVFAGWYEDATYETPVTGDTPENGAYAKYVDEKVLNVKLQITNGTTSTSKSTNFRLITSVDSLRYQQAGFVVQVEGYQPGIITCDKVYSKVYGYEDEKQISYTAKSAFENDDSKYFATKILTGVANVAFSRNIKVTPFWKTMDGTTVSGTERTVVISELLDVYYKLELSGVKTGSLADYTTVEEVTVRLKNSSSTDTVTVVEDETTEERYIEVNDNTTSEEGIRLLDIDFSSGVKTIAFDLKVNSCSGGFATTLFVKDNTNLYVCVQIGKYIQYYDGSAGKYVGVANQSATGDWDSVVLVVDSDHQTFTLYYNGAVLVEDAAFRQGTLEGNAEIQIFSGASDNSNFDIKNLVIYNGKINVVYYNLDLSEVNTGSWVNGTEVNGVAVNVKKNTNTVTVVDDEITGERYLEVNDNTTSEEGIRLLDIDFSKGVKTIAFDLKVNSCSGGFATTLFVKDNTNLYACVQIGQYIQYYDGSAGAYLKEKNQSATGDWDSVVLVVDSDKDTFTLYYNEVLIAKDVAFRQGTLEGNAEIQIFGGASDTSNFDIKNLVIYNGAGKDDNDMFIELNGDVANDFGISIEKNKKISMEMLLRSQNAELSFVIGALNAGKMDDYDGYRISILKDSVSIYTLGENAGAEEVVQETLLASKYLELESNTYYEFILEFDGDYLRCYVVDDTKGVEPWPEFEIQIDDCTGGSLYCIENSGDGAIVKNFLYADYKAETSDLKTYSNRIVEDGADPDVIYHDGYYYMLTTGTGYCVYRSQDLIEWETLPTAFQESPWGFTGRCWAPDVEYINGKFYLAVSCGEQGLGIAVSDSPAGPYKCITEQPLLAANSIDGNIFVDDDGRIYLYYTSWYDGRSYGIYGVELSSDLKEAKWDTEVKLFGATEDWEMSEYTRPDGTTYNPGIVEAPFMLKKDGKYYMVYSGSNFATKYAVGYAMSDSPLGTFEKTADSPILKGTSDVNGPGHCSVLNIENSDTMVIFYHRHLSATQVTPRPACVDLIRFAPDKNGGWKLEVYGPTTMEHEAVWLR